MEFASDIRRRRHVDQATRRTSASNPTRNTERGVVIRSLDFGTRRQETHTSTPGSFYGNSRRRNEGEHSGWMPGEILPVPRSSTPDPFSANCSPASGSLSHSGTRTNNGSQDQIRMFDLLQTFQATIDNKLGTVVNDLVSIKSTLERLETRQSALENELHNSSLSSSVPSTPTMTPGAKRKRVTPTALQSKIRRVHGSFDEEKQLRTSEPINSAHNALVVESIIGAIGNDTYSEDQIRRGCTTYRKTLVGKAKQVSTPVKKKKRIRSRKQRIYERRAKSVKSREMALWKQITADMMSDEEKRGDTFVRRQPSYRSEKLNSFLSKLDDRFERQHSQQPRTKRLIGPPVDKPIPSHAKNWMIKKDLRKSAGQGSQEAEQEVDNVHESNSEGGSVADNSGNENSGAGVENYESSDSDSDEY